MRSFAIAVGMTSLVAALGFWLAPERPPVAGLRAEAGAPSAERGPAADPASEPSETAAAPPNNPAASPSASGKRTFYQWTDERGSVRFAQSLEQVPPEWRARAGQVEVDTTRFQPKPARGPGPAPRPARPQRAGHSPLSARGPAEARPAFHDVTVYTAPWCGYCRKTLAFLDQRGIDYVNKDIEADEDYAAELIEKSGGHSVPFIEIDGSQIRGYNPRQMAALLE